jgi:hypothetical protein
VKTPLLLATLALAPLLSCASADGGSKATATRSGAVRFESLARQEQSSLAEPERRVIRSAQAWHEAWARINTYRMPAPPPPEVDFEREMVVLVALGPKPTAGHAVEVVAVEREGGFLRVRARVSEPGPGTDQAQVITHPFHAVRLERSDGPVEIVVE